MACKVWLRKAGKLGEVRNRMGSGEAKELTYTTHGHELRWGNAGGKRGTRQRGTQGEKLGELYNCNSIINKIYLKKKPSKSG